MNDHAGAPFFRECPSCGTENEPSLLRCPCGALLTGIDLSRREPPVAPVESNEPDDTAAAHSGKHPDKPVGKDTEMLRCPHEDCAQENPPGQSFCLYCNRPLAPVPQLSATEPLGLMRLPPELAGRFRLLKLMPSSGAEAELMLVERSGGEICVAKIYRHGIIPRPEVRARIQALDPRHCVPLLESGISSGHAWELMEYCAHGSLRDLLRQHNGPAPASLLHAMAVELATALIEVHSAGLVHRDLKPENILIRTLEPLDLVLTDFGIASTLDATQRFTGQARTLPYAAPESLSGVIDGKTDYWALGMILLEGALGQHPFAGLSEAVILHHLTTQPMATRGVSDARLRLLIRGLLLRDPGQRWGADELLRWQNHDLTLDEPREELQAGARAETALGEASLVEPAFVEPYHLAGERCQTRQQLAVALARHWALGVRDLDNGLLLEWFRKVQKDQDTVRLLIELRHERQLHVDSQLLRLIVHLAPGLPPVWRGDSIELPAVLKAANRALKGEESAIAWLDALYQHGALGVWALAGNSGVAELLNRWQAASGHFSEAWQKTIARLQAAQLPREAGEPVLYDDVVYGQKNLLLPSTPPLRQLHPRFLAVSYDTAWADRLRERLLAALAPLRVDCPWLGALGDPEQLAASELLVLEALLQEARKSAEKVRQARERRVQDEAQALNSLCQEVAEAQASLRAAAAEVGGWPQAEAISRLCQEIARFQHLALRVRALAGQEEKVLALRKNVMRCEMLLDRVDAKAHEALEALHINRGWLGSSMLAAFVAVLFLLPLLFNSARFSGAIIVCGAALVVWRMVPLYLSVRELRSLLTRL